MSKLRTRILTALVLVPAALAAVFFLSPWGFRMALAVLLLIGSWEFRALADLGRYSAWALTVLQVLLILFMGLFWQTLIEHSLIMLASACLAWCLLFSRLVAYRDGQTADDGYRAVSFISALAGVSFAWFSLGWLHEQPGGQYLFLLLLLIIWAADTGAYFSGRSLGRHKLAPHISPGKTREGLIGGLILSCGIALLIVHLSGWIQGSLGQLLVLFVVTVLASAAGDLFISLHKRTVGIKDTGKLFPGHGGVLDRLDSLLAGAPFFALGIRLLNS